MSRDVPSESAVIGCVFDPLQDPLGFPAGLGASFLLDQNLLLAAQYEPGGWLYENTSRASTATRTNSSGLIESVAIDVPRLQHDKDGNPLGYLHEPQATNELPYSDLSDFVLTNISRTLNADGTATELALTGSGALTGCQKTVAGLTASAAKTFSVLFRVPSSGAADYLMVGFAKSASAWAGLQVSLSGTPAVAVSGAASFTLENTSVRQLTGDIWLAEIAVTPASDTTIYATVYPSNALWDGASDVRQTLTADNSAVLIEGAQIEDTTEVATSLIPTSGLPATRQADDAEIDVPADSDGFAYVTYGDGGEMTFAVTPGGTWSIPTDLDDTYARIIFKR